MAGYHKAEIVRGKLGEISKIQEELDELKDAETQGGRILVLCELSDIMGAIMAYMEKHTPGYTIVDIGHMAKMTREAFEDGSRR